MLNNTWFKLATVSLAGIVIILVILWGVSGISKHNSYDQMNMGYGYQMNGIQMGPQNGMNMQGGMNMNGNINMGGMNIQGGMSGNMQGGMGMK